MIMAGQAYGPGLETHTAPLAFEAVIPSQQGPEPSVPVQGEPSLVTDRVIMTVWPVE